MVRRPLQSIPVHQTMINQINKTPELCKPMNDNGPLRKSSKQGNSVVSTEKRLGSSKEKSTVKKLPPTGQSRSRISDATTARIPFTIFEDNPSPNHQLKGKISQEMSHSGLKNRDKSARQHPPKSTKVAPSPDKENVSALQIAEKAAQEWKDLAETRRMALEEALKENKQLYNILESYKRENEAFQDLAEKAKLLEDLVEELTEQERVEIRHIGTQTDLGMGIPN
ncbi:uncharacterized protein LOC129586212 isoform X3 [Paramacrobiotus metropolitanus]|nr:uncharacterized protein LOC129586212 isoform X3 [Paramacrobiotus metropolitanus]